ncbi:GAF domain-containing protein [Deinococcus hohokamensis]|uniref:GAF domain-containing protein n=1 Tax=Deinococcus hohokamensis TaxID=309883 RepID=A0ABV9I5Q1_9DEIO
MPAQVDAEYARLEALARYRVLDTLPEATFDRLVNLAARLFNVPIALISLVDNDRAFFKACVGIDTRQNDRSTSFCTHALHSPNVMVVPDTTQDERFALNPLVVHSPNIRFYAGAPLVTPDGFTLGTLCVLDSQPRLGFTPQERQTLADLAALVVDELELRFRTLELEREANANASLLRALRESQAYSETLLGVNALLQLVDLPLDEVAAQALALVAQATDTDWGALVSVQGNEAHHRAVWARPGNGQTFAAAVPERLVRPNGMLWTAVGRGAPVYVDAYPEQTEANRALVDAGLQGVAMVPLGTYQDSTFLMVFARVDAPRPWRTADRALLEAATSTVAQALHAADVRHQEEVAASTDPLTGLGNAAALHGALEDAGTAPAALCCVMLRGLQAVTARAGQERGDALLRLLAETLKGTMPPGTALFRLGGTFAALGLAPGRGTEFLPAEAWAAAVQEALQAALQALRGAGFVAVDLSCGVAASPQDAATPADAWALAQTRCRAHLAQLLDSQSPDPEGAADPHRSGGEVQYGILRVQRGAQRAMVGDEPLALSPTEVAILAALASAPGQVLSREELASAIGHVASTSNALDVHVGNVRRKLARVSQDVQVRSVRGAGYTLQVSVPSA